jgi:hypothetical protein
MLGLECQERSRSTLLKCYDVFAGFMLGLAAKNKIGTCAEYCGGFIGDVLVGEGLYCQCGILSLKALYCERFRGLTGDSLTCGSPLFLLLVLQVSRFIPFTGSGLVGHHCGRFACC